MRIFCTYSAQTARERVRKQRVMNIVRSITLSVPRSSLKCEVVYTLKGREENFKKKLKTNLRKNFRFFDQNSVNVEK